MILRRIEGERFSEVLPLWNGETVVLLAGGPSLTMEQTRHVATARESGEVRCIAVNDTFLVASWADVHYAADSCWHGWMTKGIAKPFLGLTADQVRGYWEAFPGQKCTIQNSGANVTDERVHMMRNREGMGLSLAPRVLVSGRNSGFQALNLAVLSGSKRIILLGYDGAPAASGKDHWHDAHPRPTPAAAYPLYRQAMSDAKKAIQEAGVEVLNASPGSAIDAFPRVELEAALGHG